MVFLIHLKTNQKFSSEKAVASWQEAPLLALLLDATDRAAVTLRGEQFYCGFGAELQNFPREFTSRG
jgi:hypothetical protein